MRRFFMVILLMPLWSPFIVAQAVKDTAIFRTQTLKEVLVWGNSPQSDNLEGTQMGTVTLDAKTIISTPVLLGEPDILKALQTQAGVSGGVEGFAGMYVRGGENDQNLFLLNHLPLYSVYHFGGLFSSFNPVVTDKVEFYKAAFPARHGGRTSSITDIVMRVGDFHAYHGQATLGLTSGNAFLTGPLIEDKMAFSVGLRRSWLDIVTIPALAIRNRKKKDDGNKDIAGYAFTDANLKLDYKAGRDVSGYAHFYYGDDYLKIGEEHFSPFVGSEDREKNVSRLNWSNTGAATGLTYNPFIELFLKADAYYSHYASRFQQFRDENASTYDHKTDKNGIDDIGLSLEVDNIQSNNLILKGGVGYIHHQYHPENSLIESSNYLLERKVNPSVTAHEVSAWEDNTVSPVQWLQLYAGIRCTYYLSADKGRLTWEPRASIRVLLGENVSVKGSYARMNQFVQQVSNNYISLPTDGWMPIGDKWKPLESDHVSLGVYGNIGKGTYFSLEGYYKWMRHLLEYREEQDLLTTSDWSGQLTEGRGTAYGIDLSIHKDIGRLTGVFNYGLLWNNRQFDELNGGRPFPAKYDNRHKININAFYQLNDRMNLNVGWTYMTGNRMTIALNNYRGMELSGFPDDIAPTGYHEYWGINLFGNRNNVRLPAYHRLDLGLDIHHRFPSGHERIWSFGLYNAYCNMNPVTIMKRGVLAMNGEEGLWNTKFQTFSLLPVIPSVSYTFKF